MAAKSVAKKSTATSQKKTTGTKATKTVATRKAPAKAVKTSKKAPSHEDISMKAHEIYLERMAKGEPGTPESDWLKAMKALKG